jgi:hypothetical protein
MQPWLFRLEGSDRLYVLSSNMEVFHVSGPQGAIAEAVAPGWASTASTITVAADVELWLLAL